MEAPADGEQWRPGVQGLAGEGQVEGVLFVVDVVDAVVRLGVPVAVGGQVPAAGQ